MGFLKDGLTYDYLVYDGDCGVCDKFVELFRKMDRTNRFVMVPYQVIPETEAVIGEPLSGKLRK